MVVADGVVVDAVEVVAGTAEVVVDAVEVVAGTAEVVVDVADVVVGADDVVVDVAGVLDPTEAPVSSQPAQTISIVATRMAVR